MNQEEESNKRSLDTIRDSDARRLLVRAGPGTGKTSALIKRVKRLLGDGIQPEKILVLTFSRAAAADLKKKLEKLHGDKPCPKVKASTVHAYCLDLLNRVAPTPRLLLEYEEKFLLEDLNYIGQGGSLEKFKAALAGLTGERFPSIQKWLKFHNVMLIEEVVPKAFYHLESPSHIFRTGFDHILVDEYQDLNTAEQEFLDLLAKDSNFTVVGDENQSIYSFRHASPEGISRFEERHPDREVVKLKICHRCPSKIVNMANQLISPENPVLLANRCRGLGETQILISKNLEEEAKKLVTFIKRKIDSGEICAEKILVLARVPTLVPKLLEAFKDKGVNFSSFFRIKNNPEEIGEFQETEACTLLTLAENPKDRAAFRCWCGFGHKKLQAKSWNKIQRECARGESLYDVLELIRTNRLTLEPELLLEGSAQQIPQQQIMRRLNALKDSLQELDRLSGKEELLDFLFPIETPDSKSIRTMFNSLEEEASTAHLLEILRNNFLGSEILEDAGYVRVMSTRKSKGLTADLVIIMGFVDGQIPCKKGDGLEEERRLLYVLITRASQILILSKVNYLPNECRSGRRNEKKTFKTRKSPFIRELGETAPPRVHYLSPSKGP